jgi:hypothetical protein
MYRRDGHFPCFDTIRTHPNPNPVHDCQLEKIIHAHTCMYPSYVHPIMGSNYLNTKASSSQACTIDNMTVVCKCDVRGTRWRRCDPLQMPSQTISEVQYIKASLPLIFFSATLSSCPVRPNALASPNPSPRWKCHPKMTNTSSSPPGLRSEASKSTP